MKTLKIFLQSLQWCISCENFDSKPQKNKDPYNEWKTYRMNFDLRWGKEVFNVLLERLKIHMKSLKYSK